MCRLSRAHVLLLLLVLSACWVATSALDSFTGFRRVLSSLTAPPTLEPPTFAARVIAEFPHDKTSFTQGLVFEPSGTLLESTGVYGASTARRVQIETGETIAAQPLSSSQFGEGIAVQSLASGPRLLQLTWLEGDVLVRDPATLELRGTLPLPAGMREGWGLCSDPSGDALFASDGSATLRVLHGEQLALMRAFEVRAAGRPLDNLNELEWCNGEIWANLWREERIAVINPATGEVRCFVDLSSLLSPAQRRSLSVPEEAVPNGLAYDADGDRLFCTGKLWPTLFQIAVDEPAGAGIGHGRRRGGREERGTGRTEL